MTMQLSAPKGSKCVCGKRAKSTMMSRFGSRPILPVCTKCGLIAMAVMKAIDADEAAPPQAEDTLPELRSWLIANGGLSSYTLVYCLVPELRELGRSLHGSFGEPNSYPHDPSDFMRCYEALKRIPDGVARLPEVAAKLGGVWAELAPAWAELTALYEEEIKRPDKRAPKLYARLQELERKGCARHK